MSEMGGSVIFYILNGLLYGVDLGMFLTRWDRDAVPRNRKKFVQWLATYIAVAIMIQWMVQPFVWQMACSAIAFVLCYAAFSEKGHTYGIRAFLRYLLFVFFLQVFFLLLGAKVAPYDFLWNMLTKQPDGIREFLMFASRGIVATILIFQNPDRVRMERSEQHREQWVYCLSPLFAIVTFVAYASSDVDPVWLVYVTDLMALLLLTLLMTLAQVFRSLYMEKQRLIREKEEVFLAMEDWKRAQLQYYQNRRDEDKEPGHYGTI